jgi:two-component system sensor histidine kinase CpxA
VRPLPPPQRPRLFLRIFLSFCLAMLFSGGAFLAVTLALGNDPMVVRWYIDQSGAMRLCARSVAEQYEEHGSAAAERFLRDMETETELHLTLLDAHGNRIAGHPATAIGRRDAAEAWQKVMPGSVYSDRLRRASAFPVLTPRRTRFTLLSQLPGGARRNLMAPGARTVVMFLGAAFICYGLARSLTAPILALQTAARSLARGELSARAADLAPTLPRRRDELGDLCRDFDYMAERLETVLNSQKRLLADISHELRSPLARMGVALELARARTPEGSNTSLDRIAREAERMNVLIEELLTLARLEARNPEAFERFPADLHHLVREVAADADFEATARGCRCEAFLPGEALSLWGDAETLHRAVENVTRNAVRYTAPGTTVTLTLRREGEVAVLTVRDHGPGVPEEHLSDLFTPFWREAEARDRASGGVGLGLAIAHQAVLLHRGSIQGENIAEGGLLVTVMLPLG